MLGMNENELTHMERLEETFLAKASKILGRNIDLLSDEAEDAYEAMREGISAEHWAEMKMDDILTKYGPNDELPGSN